METRDLGEPAEIRETGFTGCGDTRTAGKLF
jgi:hypothetical protein